MITNTFAYGKQKDLNPTDIVLQAGPSTETLTKVNDLNGGTLIPSLGFYEEALVYIIGMKKYGRDNWRTGEIKYSTVLAKMMRHLGNYLNGEDRCSIDKQHHLASVKFWCNYLMEMDVLKPELDDIRKKKE